VEDAVLKRWLGIACSIVVAISAGSCVVDPYPPPSRTVIVEPTLPPLNQGTLILRWTINGLQDPNECVRGAAANVELSIVDVSGREVAAYQQQCVIFSMSVPLYPGSYTASAVLLDAGNQPRTTRVFIDPFSIVGGDTFDVQVDFPPSSFF
jgi:hypothetical protein